MKELKIWTLVTLVYLSMFLTPIVAAYILFNDQITEKQGGGFFYFVVAATFIFFAIKLKNVLKKMKAGFMKAIFKFIISFTMLYISFKVIQYVELNFDDLARVVAFTILGRVASLVFELWAVKIDKIYLEEIGVV